MILFNKKVNSKINSKINKKINIKIILLIVFVVLCLVSIYIFWNRRNRINITDNFTTDYSIDNSREIPIYFLTNRSYIREHFPCLLSLRHYYRIYNLL